MSKHEQVEDKRSRRVIGGIFGSVALAGIFAIGGFLLGNATADSAMGADTTDVVAQPAGTCVITPETAMYLATFLQNTGGVVVDPAASVSTVNDEEITSSGSGSATGTSFDTVVTGNGDGGTGTPGTTPDPTPVPDPTVTPDPTPPVDPTPEADDDCDHEQGGNHEHDADHEHDGHHEDSEHHSGDC